MLVRVHLQYGRDGLDVDLPRDNVTVVAPRYVPGLPDERAAFRAAIASPIASPPLVDIVRREDRVAIVIPDITRPLPSDRLLPWLLEAISYVPDDRIVIVNGTGSHRANTAQELSAMVGADVFARYRVVNHDSHDPSMLTSAGTGQDGQPVLLNRDYVDADRRIVLGFIEPHFMAGFSGGAKAVFPGVADISAIMRYHDARMIGDPKTTWGLLEGNPTQARIRHDGTLVPIDFCINVTLNRDRHITRFFCGKVRAAHDEGCAFSRETAMVGCPKPFDIVVTTNSGYPLDQNLYQAVKGMSAAAQVVAPHGYIATAARCNDGFPSHGNFRSLLMEHDSPEALLDTILAPGFLLYDQWEAQMLANIQLKARVGLLSELPDEDVRRAHLEPIRDIAAVVTREIARRGPDAAIAVLPEGPMTIPYLAQ
jgi:nickel-dependent lactate racemase